jgi:hypothetical protein
LFQAAMEAEIRSTLSARSAVARMSPLGGGALLVRSFLTALAPVISREPTVFMRAAVATCTLEEVGARALVSLKKPKVGGGQRGASRALGRWCPQLLHGMVGLDASALVCVRVGRASKAPPLMWSAKLVCADVAADVALSTHS